MSDKRGIGAKRLLQVKEEFNKIYRLLKDCPVINKIFFIPKAEYISRQKRVYNALKEKGISVGMVFCDEHYNGDVPYLGGNTNITVEQVGGIIGRTGFHIIAGLEGGYVSEQLAYRANAKVHKVEMLKLADEEYPINAEKVEDIIRGITGGRVKK